MIQRMGSLREIMERLPFFSGLSDQINIDDSEITRIKSMIQSMTKEERREPDLMFSRSRQVRVARGSGHSVKEVGELMQRFSLMRNMMGRLGTNTGWLSKIPGLGQINSLRQLNNMDFTDLFGSMVNSALPEDPSELLKGLPRGYTPPGFKGGPLTKEQKQKRKLARMNRKKK